jgi:asparagine synthase (glutamine-hydrolysing)
VGSATDRLLPASRRGIITGNSVHKLASVLGLGNVDEMYRRLVSTWPDPDRIVHGAHEPDLPWQAMKAELPNPAERMMLFDLLGYLPDDILAKVDRASMGTSLEVRAPLLDHRVVEFAWRLPVDQKIRDGVGKWILRRVLERHVPRSLFERPKHGFGIPIDAWLRGPLREWAEDLLSQQRLEREGFLDPTPVRSALREHLQGKKNHQYRLWTVLMFESWLEQRQTVGRPR